MKEAIMNMFDAPMPFALIAFCALSIERVRELCLDCNRQMISHLRKHKESYSYYDSITLLSKLLYSYCYIFTDHFKSSVDQNKIPGITKLSQERCYWKCMQRLGMYIKVFQFSVVIYDLLVLDFENVKYNLVGGGMLESEDKIRQLSVGMLLIFIGQVLNYNTFQALGAKGVYYGYEFGYSVDRVTCFPYNLHIDDPQYWGVVLCIFGIYMAVGASSFLVPCFELFWYLMSMKVLENERGVYLVKVLTGFEKKKVA